MKRYLAVAALAVLRVLYGIGVWVVWSALMGVAAGAWLFLHALALGIRLVDLLRRAAQTPKD